MTREGFVLKLSVSEFCEFLLERQKKEGQDHILLFYVVKKRGQDFIPTLLNL
jgi:hypothetical protein